MQFFAIVALFATVQRGATGDEDAPVTPASPWGSIGPLMSLGVEMAASAGIGLAIGYWLDKLTGWSPWLTFIFLLLGLAAGFRSLVVRVRQLGRDRDGDEQRKTDGLG